MNAGTAPEDDDKKNQREMIDLANKFVALANNMRQKDRKESWIIGSALRYAAARFSAHESSLGSSDLLKDRDELESWFSAQFKTMLIANMQQEIELLADKK